MDIQEIITFDKELLLALNGSDSLLADGFMWGITSTVAWIPMAIMLLYLIIKNNSFTDILLVIVFFALTILIADQFSSSFCKPFFARYRPTHDSQIMYMVDVVRAYRGGNYGFISSHAANTFGVCVFLSLLIRDVRLSLSLLGWAVLCSYSRIYLGVHFPGDILCGAVFGSLAGLLCYAFYFVAKRRLVGCNVLISSQYTSSGYALSDVNVFLLMLNLTYVLLAVAAVFLGRS